MRFVNPPKAYSTRGHDFSVTYQFNHPTPFHALLVDIFLLLLSAAHSFFFVYPARGMQSPSSPICALHWRAKAGSCRGWRASNHDRSLPFGVCLRPLLASLLLLSLRETTLTYCPLLAT